MLRLSGILALVSIVSIFSYKNFRKDRLELVWNDEFDKKEVVDLTKWTAITGNGCPELCGFGNNEAQYYTDHKKNVRVENGILVIEAHNDSIGENAYTSAKLVSLNKGDWHTGVIEVRAKLPKGRGTWPAIWMLPSLDRKLSWPLDGEIDIMEHVGYNQGTIYGTIHTEKYNHGKGTQKTDSIYIDDVSQNFHVYKIEWSEDQIQWYVDDQLYNTVKKGTEGKEGWPFNNEFHLILNLAVGGNWGGKHGIDSTVWPQKMEIDYVRVYQ